jgi:UDP-GlcNAc:undecaprenyl-phosphate GlcNAc-1-phosphate transferase
MAPVALANHLLFGVLLFAVSTVLTWCMLRLGLMAMPNRRSSHEWPIPNSGGVAIVLTFFAGFVVLFYVGDEALIGSSHMIGFAVAGLGVAAVSLADDLGQFRSFKVKLIAQFSAALVLVAFGIVFRTMSLPVVGTFDLGWWGYPMTILWVVAMTNIFNFMDGLDGLAGGCGAIVAIFFGVITALEGSHFVYILCYVLLSSALGFLIFNFPKARIFMGDVGSQFLGFGFAALAVIAAEYDTSRTSLLIMPLLFFHFIFDTTFTFFRRLFTGQNVTQAHRGHLYQLMNQLGVSHFGVSSFHFAVTVAQGIGAWVLIEMQTPNRILVFAPFVLFQILYAAVIIRMSRARGLLDNP